MNWALKVGGAIAALAIIGLVTWRVAYPNYEWHQKITVEVESPQGPVSASSVAEVAWWGVPKVLPDASPRDWSVKADAVVLQLPNGRYLFALVGNAHLIARAVLFDSLPSGSDPYLYPASQMRRFDGQVHDIPPEHYPLLVTFDDIADPTTLKRVDPDDLARSFGSGVSLKRITLEITDEKVTEGEVEEVLEWLDWPKIDPSLNAGRSEALRYPNDSPRGYGTLSTNDFVRRP